MSQLETSSDEDFFNQFISVMYNYFTNLVHYSQLKPISLTKGDLHKGMFF